MSFVTTFLEAHCHKKKPRFSGHYIPAHAEACFPLPFQSENSSSLIFYLDFCTKFTVFMFTDL